MIWAIVTAAAAGAAAWAAAKARTPDGRVPLLIPVRVRRPRRR